MDLLIQRNVRIRKEKVMEEITKYEMMKTCGGGLSITGALVEAVSGVIEVVFGIGQALGSAIRRISGNKLCGF